MIVFTSLFSFHAANIHIIYIASKSFFEKKCFKGLFPCFEHMEITIYNQVLPLQKFLKSLFFLQCILHLKQSLDGYHIAVELIIGHVLEIDHAVCALHHHRL